MFSFSFFLCIVSSHFNSLFMFIKFLVIGSANFPHCFDFFFLSFCRKKFFSQHLSITEKITYCEKEIDMEKILLILIRLNGRLSFRPSLSSGELHDDCIREWKIVYHIQVENVSIYIVFFLLFCTKETHSTYFHLKSSLSIRIFSHFDINQHFDVECKKTFITTQHAIHRLNSSYILFSPFLHRIFVILIAQIRVLGRVD